MQRLEYDRYGGPEEVRLASFTLPKLRPHEVQVRVAAASINPMDWKIRGGQMKLLTGLSFPRAMGTDFSGTIEAMGSEVSKFRLGDAVLGTVSMKRSGAFAGRLITAESLVVPKPANLSFVEAACLPIAGVTAWQALVKAAKLERGESLFINGAMGAVGRAAIAISQLIGADATGRVRLGSFIQGRALGLTATLDYAKPLPASLDASFDVVFDCNGSLSVRQAARLLKPGGVIVDIAPTSSKFLCALVSRSRKILFADLEEGNLREVVGLAAAGKLAIPVARTLRLEEAPGLLASLERGERLDGKAVITFAE